MSKAVEGAAGSAPHGAGGANSAGGTSGAEVASGANGANGAGGVGGASGANTCADTRSVLVIFLLTEAYSSRVNINSPHVLKAAASHIGRDLQHNAR